MLEQEEIYTPSYHGEKCRQNGESTANELACDECPYYMICFPDWEYLDKQYSYSDDESYHSILTSSSETLEAYLQASALWGPPSTDEERNAIQNVEKELLRRLSAEKMRHKSKQAAFQRPVVLFAYSIFKINSRIRLAQSRTCCLLTLPSATASRTVSG